ncbi:MAG: hypothetical protein H7273_00350 [Polaromonas sp.]|nr:hypothetical protein [Polaromonas sp.]
MQTSSSSSWLRQAGALLAAALLLCLAALWNGQAFFYPDTPTYLRGAEMGASRVLGPATFKPWLPAPQADSAQGAATQGAAESPKRMKALTSIEDKVVLAGRSVYYGALVYAGFLAGKMWLTVAVQALAVAYVLQLLMGRLWGLGSRQVIGIAAALSLLTPLGVYTGFLMPDVFAPLVILCFGALAVYWPQLGRSQRWMLSLILLFGLLAHASHVALAALLLLLALAARWLGRRWRGLSVAALVVTAGCVAGAVAAEWAFGKAVTMAVGAPPMRLPHPMARLIDLGPGTAYLKQSCPGSGFAACAYLPNYPTAWDDFLFSTDPEKGAFALADGPAKRRLSDEQLRFVGAVIRFDPAGVVRGIGADVLRQLVNFRVDISAYGSRGLAMFEGRVPDSIFADMQASRAASQQASLNTWLTVSTYALALASLVVLIGEWLRSGGSAAPPADPARQRFANFVWLVVAGVVANAVICATLASSMDRFQARVVWLLPFMALATLARARAQGALASRADTVSLAATLPLLQKGNL